MKGEKKGTERKTKRKRERRWKKGREIKMERGGVSERKKERVRV